MSNALTIRFSSLGNRETASNWSFRSFDGSTLCLSVISMKGKTFFVLNVMGQLIAGSSNQTSQTLQISYLTNSHGGSLRINTDANGAVV